MGIVSQKKKGRKKERGPDSDSQDLLQPGSLSTTSSSPFAENRGFVSYTVHVTSTCD